MLSGCVAEEDAAIEPPAGLNYSMPSASYVQGEAIVPNRPSASGGAIARYMVAPPLPAGLSLDEGTVSSPGRRQPPRLPRSTL
ncbi:hypothetical protein CNE_2c11510 [Cupriavidus necator N-1]|uniref:Uncharacterized protein n=1 Tax=Cupriavidus necator (strain ATCC 43291 / DSM 13513 / CCUG 52238 / LMG 8453 / N-1) TaxID=1042878 RepID=F8GM98_CUPNN|nr:hypothetical protein CNE_2c11510 [Cupriavidus necator N-1]